MTDTVRAAPTTDTPAQAGPEVRSGAGLLGARRRQHRCRLRRHRHEPALRVPRSDRRRFRARTRRACRTTVLGVVSLILWALFIVVTLKYVVILLRADNNGEGGTLTLMALATRALGRVEPGRRIRRAARHHQRRAVLRRRRHYAGAVGSFRDRGHGRRHPGIARLRGADHRGDPDPALCLPVAGYGEGRGPVRADHDRSGSSRSRFRVCFGSHAIPACCGRSIRPTASLSLPTTE